MITILMSLALDRRVRHLQIVGDSKLIFSWLDGSLAYRNLNLCGTAARAIKMKTSFHDITFHHVMRQINQSADSLSKQACDRPVASLLEMRFMRVMKIFLLDSICITLLAYFHFTEGLLFYSLVESQKECKICQEIFYQLSVPCL